MEESVHPNLEEQEQEIKSLVLKELKLEKVTKFSLIAQRVNAHFLIEEDSKKSILRIYREVSNWLDSESSYQFEIDLMNFLKENDFNSSFPLSSDYIEIPLNNKKLRGILLSYAEGELSSLSAKESYLFGETVGKFHKITNSFKTINNRFEYDKCFLIEESYSRMAPWARKTSRMSELDRVHSHLNTFYDQLDTDGLDFGVVHGDFNGNNHHIKENGDITIYDFDMSGYGLREYDLAVFLRVCLIKEIDVFEDFLKGYSESYKKPLLSLESLMSLSLARQYWQTGLLSTFPEYDQYYEAHFQKEMDFSISILELIKKSRS